MTDRLLRTWECPDCDISWVGPRGSTCWLCEKLPTKLGRIFFSVRSGINRR